MPCLEQAASWGLSWRSMQGRISSILKEVCVVPLRSPSRNEAPLPTPTSPYGQRPHVPPAKSAASFLPRDALPRLPRSPSSLCWGCEDVLKPGWGRSHSRWGGNSSPLPPGSRWTPRAALFLHLKIQGSKTFLIILGFTHYLKYLLFLMFNV